jgi:hypothetical protein
MSTDALSAVRRVDSEPEPVAAADAGPWPTVRDDLRTLIRAAARAERSTVDAATVDWLLDHENPPDAALADRIACLERLRLDGASVLEVGSVLGELSRTARTLGAEVVHGVQLEPALVRLAGLINAYRHVSRVSFHRGLDDLDARCERYDIAIVSVAVTVQETIRAVELADRAVVLELTGAIEPSVLCGALAPGFPSTANLGEVSGRGEPSVMLALARDEETLLELVSGASHERGAPPLEQEVEHP